MSVAPKIDLASIVLGSASVSVSSLNGPSAYAILMAKIASFGPQMELSSEQFFSPFMQVAGPAVTYQRSNEGQVPTMASLRYVYPSPSVENRCKDHDFLYLAVLRDREADPGSPVRTRFWLIMDDTGALMTVSRVVAGHDPQRLRTVNVSFATEARLISEFDDNPHLLTIALKHLERAAQRELSRRLQDLSALRIALNSLSLTTRTLAA